MTRVPLDAKRAVAARVRATKGSEAVAVSDVVTAAARQFGVSTRTVWRWADGRAHEARPSVGLTTPELTAIAQYQGHVKAAWKSLRTSNETTLGYHGFVRRLHNTDTDAQAAVLEGIPAALGRSLFNTREPVSRMNTVCFDHKEVPVFVVDERTGKPKKVWISVAIDHSTRYAFRPVITEGEAVKGDPNTEAIVAMIAGVLMGEEVEGTVVGGRFDNIVSDNALAHVSDAVVTGFAVLSIVSRHIRPYSPWENGKVERWMRTVEDECFSQLPGYTHHLETRWHTLPWDPDDLLTVDELALHLSHFVTAYNTRRPHERLGGRTPLQAWLDDPALVEPVDPGLVRHAFLAESQPRIISKNGVRFDKLDYQSADFSGKVGRKVTLRHLPNDRSFVDVYLDDEYLTTAKPAATLSLEEKSRIARITRNKTARLDRIVKKGARAAQEAALRRSTEEGFARPDSAKATSRATGFSDEAELDELQQAYLTMAKNAGVYRQSGGPDQVADDASADTETSAGSCGAEAS